MKIKQSVFLIAAFSLLSPAAALACEAAGPSTHVGEILNIDVVEKTFTIFDAQTASPVTFHANENLMQKMANASGTAFVDFKVYGGDLVATDVLIK